MSDKLIVARVVDRFADSHWDGKFIGKDARLQWSRATFMLEELPQKGKKKLRQATLQNPSAYSHRGTDWWIPGNILNFAKLSSGDDYDKIKSKIEAAFEMARKKASEGNAEEKAYYEANKRWMDEIQWYEHPVFFLNVAPEGVESFTAEGKDFTVKVEWGNFKAYNPDSDFQQADPYYTLYEAKSPGAGRKFYKIMKADPDALKSVAWNNFDEFLKKNGVGYDIHFSQWH